MRRYIYEAKDQATGKVVKSAVQADSEHSAARLLSDQGFAPLKITEEGEKNNVLSKITGRITSKDKIVFLRQLATLIGAGMPLSQSLHTVTEQTQNKQLQRIVEDITTYIESGHTLSDAFARYPNVFDPIIIALVKAGEASGTLDDALRRIATQKEKDAAMMSKIRGAMIYPAIVLLVIVAVLAFMLLTVVPQVEKLYDDMGKALPPLTSGMIAFANFTINYWYIVLIGLVVFGYFYSQYLKTESGIKFKDTMKLNVPLFSPMFRKLYMARFTRTGQTLLATGVPMLDMLHITSNGVNNSIIAASIERAADKVKGGKALSAALKPEDYIMQMVPQMIKIGEQSGKIDEMMAKTAQVYEDELDEEIRTISTTIEPVLMVVMAIMAGIMVGAILFPIYSLVGNT